MLLVVPELLMGNRVLRKFDGTGDKALRIQFRDDNGEALKLNQVGQTIINVTVHNTMRRGIYISDRHFIYLASSNSQMRDSGCYFFDEGEDGKQVEEIRNQLGIFNKSNIPKLMARIGQCFTQAKLRHKHYNQTFDVIGGRDTSGEPYTFSDGCGRISVKYAEDIASDLDLGNCVPSCFQIRFRGIKGVVSVDPWLSDRTEWSEKYSVPDNREKYKRKNKLRVHFRPSQNKFHGSVEMYIEIVKYSSPTGVCLNRPFIAILDQVSAMQGYKLHCRMTDRICELLDRQLMELAEALMLENRYVNIVLMKLLLFS
ncbi:unnamed protein product [Anisakis simplex]|uniref:RNA-dependent RNA polymerase n=1 Tax=Anisakis simplex TaxID=6269 RepID=A0A0M3KDR2_ANISI|nr:unnamed protein product [Anisakis simplex]